MDRLIHLFWGVITNPEETFKEIKESNPVREGLIIMLGAYLLSLFFSCIDPETSQLKQRLIGTPFMFWGLLLALAVPFVMAGILNYLAKAAKLDSTYPRVLSVILLASAPPRIILFALQSVLILLKVSILYSIAAWLATLWALVLVVIGLSIALSISLKRSVGLYLRTFLIFLGMLILSGMVIGLVRPLKQRGNQDLVQVKKDIETLEIALDLFELDNGLCSCMGY